MAYRAIGGLLQPFPFGSANISHRKCGGLGTVTLSLSLVYSRIGNCLDISILHSSNSTSTLGHATCGSRSQCTRQAQASSPPVASCPPIALIHELHRRSLGHLVHAKLVWSFQECGELRGATYSLQRLPCHCRSRACKTCPLHQHFCPPW